MPSTSCMSLLVFVASRDGPTEAGRILGLLGLPNDTTMATRSFGVIEDRVITKIQELMEATLKSRVWWTKRKLQQWHTLFFQ
jgi:hypothetical protein